MNKEPVPNITMRPIWAQPLRRFIGMADDNCSHIPTPVVPRDRGELVRSRTNLSPACPPIFVRFGDARPKRDAGPLLSSRPCPVQAERALHEQLRLS